MTGMTQPVRAVFWDMGGVIVRTEDANPRQRLAERVGRTRGELERLVFASPLGVAVQRGQVEISVLWDYVLAELGLPAEALADLKSGFWAGDAVDFELVDFIRSLRPRCKTGLISNGWPTLRRIMAEDWRIIDAFDHLVISAEVSLLKPAPAIYQLALQSLDVQAREAVFVDDFAENIVGAQQVGMRTVHFRSREQAISELRALWAS